VRESHEARRVRARSLIRHLDRAYPDAACALHFTTPLELLVATILAAQCTDERVNQVTRTLFAKYRRAEDDRMLKEKGVTLEKYVLVEVGK